MYVIGTGSQIAEYVIDQKTQRGVKIVGVSNEPGRIADSRSGWRGA